MRDSNASDPLPSFSTAALVLAAGGSSRLGRPKQLLHFEGENLVQRAVKTARSSSIDNVAVVLGEARAEISVSLPPAVRTFHNPEWSHGMGSSIAVGVAGLVGAVPGLGVIVIVLADQPLVTAAHLDRLVSALRPPISPSCAATAYDNGPGVPAAFGSVLFDSLRDLSDDIGARQLMRRGDIAVATVVPDFPLLDVDTEQDYGRLLDLSRS